MRHIGTVGSLLSCNYFTIAADVTVVVVIFVGVVAVA